MTVTPGSGLTLEAAASLSASLDGTTEELRRGRKFRADLLQNIRYIGMIPLPQLTGSGTANAVDVPNLMGPRTGWAWDVHRFTCVTFTGGTVSFYLDGVADGNQVMVFTTAGVSLLGKAQVLVEPGHRLIAAAVNLTGNATMSLGVTEIAQSYLGDYLL